jgi:hypothetical protein
MSGRCTFADDHDLQSSELATRAAACGVCADVLARGLRAKGAWQWANVRDDATERSARERRLKSVGGVRRAQGQRAAWPLRAAAFALAIAAMYAVMGWVRAPPRGAPSAGEARVVSGVPVEAARTASSSPSIAPTEEVGLRVLAVDGGPSDGSHRKLEVGRTLRSGDSIDVPNGGFVDVGYLADTASWIGITGPAEADVREESSTALVVLHRGTAHATAARGAIVATDAMRTHGEHAAWVVEATPERTRVTTTQGRVDVEPPGSAAARRVVSTGEEMEIENPHVSSKEAPVSETTDTTGAWRSVEKSLDEGDRDAAESALRSVLAHEREPGRRARAALRLSELLLARGARDEARRHAESLALGRDAAMASEAVWLYVRSFPTPQGRASAWARFLATSPLGPMMHVARVERARELLDAGETGEARAIIQALSGEALEPVAADGLAGLRARVEGTGGDGGGDR